MTKKKTLEQQVYEIILNQVMIGEYAPGTHLTESMLVKQLQTSRTPIRRALSRLEAEGIVKHDSHCGATVKHFRVSIQDYISMLEIRVQFFEMSLRKATRKQIPFDLVSLNQTIKELYEAISDDNAEAYYKGLSQLHRLLLAPAKNELVIEIMEDLEEKFRIGGSHEFIYEVWKPMRYALVQKAEQTVQHITQNCYEESLHVFEESTKEIIQFMIL
ncbi:GntR family transcriptional regulator [Bacillus wiedmannii]|uniref:GntR family transcriptional regulator n=1 Tax=Bacillus wiedmannii TaxID=1890302 RepID=UPI000BF16738|nr:GntR family transcriptional regulator [Bacillus wiedmannii]PEO39961.1 GntR family transcriptional regulator [Bacillus wiedmannii]